MRDREHPAMSHVARRFSLVQLGAAVSLLLVAAACSSGAQSGGVASVAPPAPSVMTAVGTSGAPAVSAPVSAAPETLPTITGSETQPPVQAAATPVPLDPAAAALAGTYRCLSRALYYDQGGGGGTGTCDLFTPLSLGADGHWSWETSSGSWHVRPVTAADWEGWGIQPYGGVTQVLVLDGLGQGPIEPDSGFVWVIYHDASVAGTVWLKWGRAS